MASEKHSSGAELLTCNLVHLDLAGFKTKYRNLKFASSVPVEV